MKNLLVFAMLGMLSIAGCASKSNPPGGPMCRVGCRCGNACIDCSDRCHKADEDVTDAGL